MSWLLANASVIFDVDSGPKVTHLFPPMLSEEEQRDMAFHSFPDSMSMELCSARTGTLRDSCFWFRIKRSSTSDNNGDSSTSSAWLYMFVFCRQRQDHSLRRGGEQLSVVCISAHPFSSILRPLSQVAGALFFSHGTSGLDNLYEESLSWPPPATGLNSFEVGMTNLKGLLPHASALPFPTSLQPSLLDPNVNDNGNASVWFDRESDDGEDGQELFYPTEREPQDTMRRTWHEADRSSDRQEDQEAISYCLEGEGEGGSTVRQALPSYRHTTDVITQRPPTMNDVPASPSSALSSPFTSAIEAARIASGELMESRRLFNGSVPSSLLPTLPPNKLANGQEDTRFLTASILPPLTSLGTAFCEVDVFTPLQSHLNKLWHIWEMVILAQPLMVVGLSPCDTSQTIASLISLIGPLPFRPDFRPFLTIHDASYAALSSLCVNPGSSFDKTNPDVPLLFGVTNLYFIKALESWPNILSVGRKETAASSWTETKAQKNANVWGGGLLAGIKATLQNKSRGAQSLLFEGHSESLWSSYRPLTTPDKSVLARLLKPAPTDSRTQLASIASVNNDIIRGHFYALTTSLLAPFSSYLPTSLSAPVPKWSSVHFLASAPSLAFPSLILERFGGKVPAVCDFYTRLVSSPNFCYWMSQAQSQVPPHLLINPPPLPTIATRDFPIEEDGVIGIDLFFETELALQEASDAAEISRHSSYLIHLFFRLPLDLQLICLSSPARRSLLYSLPPLTSQQKQAIIKLERMLK